MVILPAPGTDETSISRISPPTMVQARPDDHADLRLPFHHAAAVLRHAEVLLEVGRGHRRRPLAVLGVVARHLAADARDLALEPAHAGLARVAVDDGLEGRRT